MGLTNCYKCVTITMVVCLRTDAEPVLSKSVFIKKAICLWDF